MMIPFALQKRMGFRTVRTATTPSLESDAPRDVEEAWVLSESKRLAGCGIQSVSGTLALLLPQHQELDSFLVHGQVCILPRQNRRRGYQPRWQALLQVVRCQVIVWYILCGQ